MPKKSLGQNFLIDLNIIKKIINLSNIQNRHVIEIGPGNGELTDEIIKNKPKSITLIEKDFDLTKRLKKKYSENQNLIIFNDDILKFNLEKIIKKESMIIGNLPYNISSQILVKIIKFKKWPPNFFDLISFSTLVSKLRKAAFSPLDFSSPSISSNCINVLQEIDPMLEP